MQHGVLEAQFRLRAPSVVGVDAHTPWSLLSSGVCERIGQWLDSMGWPGAVVRALPRGDWPLLCIGAGQHMRYTPPDAELQRMGLCRARWDEAGLRLCFTDDAWDSLLGQALSLRLSSPRAIAPAFEPRVAYAYARAQWLLRVTQPGEASDGSAMPRDDAARRALWCALGVCGADKARNRRLGLAIDAFLPLTLSLPPQERIRRLIELRGVARVCAAVFASEIVA